jgi:hypothetical protein
MKSKRQKHSGAFKAKGQIGEIEIVINYNIFYHIFYHKEKTHCKLLFYNGFTI